MLLKLAENTTAFRKIKPKHAHIPVPQRPSLSATTTAPVEGDDTRSQAPTTTAIPGTGSGLFPNPRLARRKHAGISQDQTKTHPHTSTPTLQFIGDRNSAGREDDTRSQAPTTTAMPDTGSDLFPSSRPARKRYAGVSKDQTRTRPLTTRTAHCLRLPPQQQCPTLAAICFRVPGFLTGDTFRRIRSES